MSEELERKPRKGTRSCTECRRRKVRCTWSSNDAKQCRRCEERGSGCVAQTFTVQPSEHRTLTSRQRILQLESQVARLNRAVRGIELKLGSQPTDTPNSPGAQLQLRPGADDFDDDSSSSDVLDEDRPTHLSSLFQNEWLRVDTRRQKEQLHDRKAKTFTPLLHAARQALQKLIPSREDVIAITDHGFASKWLGLLHTLFPQPSIVRSRQDMITAYDEVCRSDVDTMSLSSWLLVLALTAAQVPQEYGSPGSQSKGLQKASHFAHSVAEVVEKTILSHDRLIGTIEGLGLVLLCGRLQIFQGNFQKGWLQLRRAIAIAELLGLPHASQALSGSADMANGAPNDDRKIQKAQLWESICALDRVAGTVLNLPAATQRYSLSKSQPLVVEGTVQPRVYLSRLADIAVKAQDADDINSSHGCGVELYTCVLDIDKELRTLTTQTPKSWWTEDCIRELEARHVLQFWQSYVTMRVHLPFTIRRDPGEEYLYSRLTGIDACRSVVRRYRTLRRAMPSTFFLGKFFDLQVFTAIVILLLASHSTPSSTLVNMHVDMAEIEQLIAEVVELMDEKSNSFVGSNFARQGAFTIRALRDLFEQDDDTIGERQLTLRVPLLGKLHVRRNVRNTKEADTTTQCSRVEPAPTSWRPNESAISQSDPMTLAAYTNTGDAQIQAEWPWDPLSWSIEDNREDVFQDAFMADNFDEFAMEFM